ncbi:MAG TPA: MOSC domain-containing protein [Asticcacaulis sp.]|nr:MOSC domain-containing protein [Asticcacaulis sp.]
MTAVHATVAALWRHPVKGFTPEPVPEALLTANEFFPFDRLFALEVGRSGYDPENPQVIPKLRFAVLARFAAVARLRTHYDEFNDRLEMTGTDGQALAFPMHESAGRHALARHVETVLSEHEDYDPVAAPLNLLDVPGPDTGKLPFRFTDSGKGFVSLLNLDSLRDLSQRAGRNLDPLRMRANVWLDGLSAFEDHAWVGRHLRIEDGPEFEVLKPIVRCVATHVDPVTAERDFDLCTALWENYGHRDCGIYVRVVKGGMVRPGDRLTLI